MESVTGQVRHIKAAEKVFDYIKRIKSERETEEKIRAFFKEFSAAKTELYTIRQNLNLITDTDAKEYCIYRLKAAELNFNRYFKLAKTISITADSQTEEVL